MSKLNLIVLFIGLVFGLNVFSQEGIAPLGMNESLYWNTPLKKSMKSRAIGDTYGFNFLFDMNPLPIIDDFSKNLFKKYNFDPWAVGNTIQVWEKYYKDGIYVASFDAMTDTSYHYTYDKANGKVDSVANPVVYMTVFSTTDYQVVDRIDTVWTWDTILVGSTVKTSHLPDIKYVNYSDTIVVVPDEGYSIWKNKDALHNYSYSNEPKTMGMVTFDGLDSTGVPYDPTMNPNSYQIADVLESKPILLKTKPNGSDYNPLIDTTIYLSFFYQPQGLGEAPEAKDSLVLEFYSPFTDTWNHVWSAPGSKVHPFKYVNINIRDPRYFFDGFKFRFYNYASVSGNFDHWNVDYVVMAENRIKDDSTLIDVGLMDNGYSLLKDYHQMPWYHYQQATTNLMKTEQAIRYRNMGTTSYTAYSKFNVYDSTSWIWDSDTGIDIQFGPLAIGERVSRFSEVFPTTGTDTIKSFTVEYLAQMNPDENKHNDTAFFHQQFGTEYAYDDGSAESAYFVTSVGAQIAVQYDLAIRDTLKAVNIYFPRSFESIIDRPYRLMIWKSLNPEEILYESYLYYPLYSNNRDLVRGIVLETPLEVEGTIFIGIKQLDKTIYVGMDQNNDSQSKNFYKVNGAWSNSSYKGSLFIRPEFGVTNPWPVSVEEPVVDDFEFKMYPNPSSSSVNLLLGEGQSTVILRSAIGVEVRRFNANNTLRFEVSNLPTGLYLVEVQNEYQQKTQVKKLLIQH